MKKHIFNQRGVSLIEVLAASAILSLVAVAAGSFLLTNLFSFNTASNSITLEREGRAALNTITDKIRESSEVEAVSTADGGTLSEEMGRTVNTLRTVTILTLSDGTQLEVQGGALKLNGTSICSSLDSGGFKAEPLPEGESFGNCTGLRINLTLKKDRKTYNIESEAYFRNSR